MRDDLSTAIAFTYSNDTTEALVLKIRDLKLLLFSVYRPPDTEPDVFTDVMNKVNEALSLAQAHGDRYPKIIGFGDLNLPEISWPEEWALRVPVAKQLNVQH